MPHMSPDFRSGAGVVPVRKSATGGVPGTAMISKVKGGMEFSLNRYG